jgi:enediyne biosynthesis protein E4
MTMACDMADHLTIFRVSMKPTAMFPSRSVCLTLGIVVVALTTRCGSGGLAVGQSELIKSKKYASATISFREVAMEAGVSFRFDTGSRGRHDLPEVMGGGVALFDADGDGLLDIYLCNGGPIERVPGRSDRPCRLYRNQGSWKFEDLTDRAAAQGPSYAMGAAVGDFDGDGRPDLLVTGWRDQRLYRNLGGGRFQDVTIRAGLSSSLWSTSAAFADLDGDGDLDLYVANYLDFDANSPPYCTAPDGRRDYCGPEDFPAQPDRLYRNNGDGTFTDVSRLAGIDQPEGRGLGVLIAELTGDGRPDIFVANDGTPCWLFANRGNLRFDEIGEAAGVARDGQGRALAGMGVAIGDVNDDGRGDLLVTNFFDRSTIAFQAQMKPAATFLDASSGLGLARCTRHVLGFGIALVDFDADGRVDLIQANGHVLDRARLGTPFAMRPTLLRNTGGQFEESVVQPGGWFERPILGRGLAVGDLDGDGRPDVVVNALDAPAAVLRNTSEAGHFLAVDIVDHTGRTAVGARVRVTAGGRTQAALVQAGGSYLSASPGRLWFGLGRAQAAERIEVEWPWGQREFWTKPTRPPHSSLRIAEGTGKPMP